MDVVLRLPGLTGIFIGFGERVCEGGNGKRGQSSGRTAEDIGGAI